MICSARSSFWRIRARSRSSASIRRASARAASGFGPRRLALSAEFSWTSISRRQWVRCELYSPSRRSSAPISPGALQAAASRRMRRLYAAEKRRRLACATTSGSGSRTEAFTRSTSDKVFCSCSMMDLPFYSNLTKEGVSRHADTGGSAKLASYAWKQHCRGLFLTPLPA